jgi:hypothetical protein
MPAKPENGELLPPYIQGTFREHSGRVERTPVSLHPNCKKHLKKSTKVDAEYNLQT